MILTDDYYFPKISVKDRKLAFCNDCENSRYISDCTKDYEVDRYRPLQEGTRPLTSLEEDQLRILETEQVKTCFELLTTV